MDNVTSRSTEHLYAWFRPEEVENGLAHGTDPALSAAVLRPLLRCATPDVLAAPGRVDPSIKPPVRGPAMLNIRAMHWPRHDRDVRPLPDRPNVPPQCLDDVLA